MKVERNKQFEPITITIETEEEAEILWHRLNIGTEYFAGYTAILGECNDNPNFNPAHMFDGEMFFAFDKVYRPKWVKHFEDD